MPTFQPLEYDFLPNTLTVTCDRKGAKAEAVFMCDWSQRFNALQSLMPSSYIVGNDIIIPPAAIFPDLPALAVSSVKVEPMWPDHIVGNPTATFATAYDKAKISVTFETLPYDQTISTVSLDGPGGTNPVGTGLQATFLEYKGSISGEFLTWPSSSLAYGSGADPTQQAAGGAQTRFPQDKQVGIIIPLIEHHITWHLVPFPPWDVIRNCVGNVNATTFFGCPPETLLFLGGDWTRSTTWDGVRVWTVNYKFAEKNMNQQDLSTAFGWNHHIRVNGYNAGQWQIVDRKTPRGDSTIAQDPVTPFSAAIQVASRASFPATVPNFFYLQVGTLAEYEIIQVGLNGDTLPGSRWPITARGQFGTPTLTWPVGTPVQSCIMTTLAADMADDDGQFTINETGAYPQLGQFFLLIDNEILCVNQRFTNFPTTFNAIRGVRGTTAAAHMAGASVLLLNSPGYQLAELNELFDSGVDFG